MIVSGVFFAIAIAKMNLLIVLLYKLFLSLFCNNEFKNFVYLHI